MLGFGRNVFGGYLSVCNELRIALNDGGLRSNGVCRHNIGINLTEGICHHLVARSGEHLLFGHGYSPFASCSWASASEISSSAPNLHS